jgi:purine-nucleoside phosphorylase
MSTVLETIAARALGLEVLGISLVTNETGAAAEVSHADVLAASQAGAENIATLVERTVGAI